MPFDSRLSFFLNIALESVAFQVQCVDDVGKVSSALEVKVNAKLFLAIMVERGPLVTIEVRAGIQSLNM